jgi:pyrroloquinoline-quinone synthase
MKTQIAKYTNIAHTHSLWNHPFLIRSREGRLSLEEVKVLAVQMYKFSKEFSKILARIFSYCPEEEAQAVILGNLDDEMGFGELESTHPALFRRFTRELGIDDEALDAMATEPETLNLIDTYYQLPVRYDYLAALGAVGFASEGIVSNLYAQIERGIQEAKPFSKEAMVFFDLHIDVDMVHAANLYSLIGPRVNTAEKELMLRSAITDALDARYGFFNGIDRAIQRQSAKLNTIDNIALQA